jgi:hypothetical protein
VEALSWRAVVEGVWPIGAVKSCKLLNTHRIQCIYVLSNCKSVRIEKYKEWMKK